MIASAFQQTGKIGRGEATGSADAFLGRMLFVFFAQDYGIIGHSGMFSDRVGEILRGRLDRTTTRVWAYVTRDLFEHFGGRLESMRVSEPGGGLFARPLPKKACFYDLSETNPASGKMPVTQGPEAGRRPAAMVPLGTNPIVANLVALSSCGLRARMPAGTLGHVFERSVRESGKFSLTGAKAPDGGSQRKREGVFYTPEPVARYICRNTIIPHLSKTGTSDVAALVGEHAGDIGNLEQKLRDIRILDPACGSGVFLAEAANTLADVHRQIRRHKSRGNGRGGGTRKKGAGGGQIGPIVENNLYGMDVNPLSTEITRFSMLLMGATPGGNPRSLPDHFVVRNSVTNTKASNWGTAFPGVDGFDIIVGNPPYVRQEEIKDKESMRLSSAGRPGPGGSPEIPKTSDLSSYFYYHSLQHLRPGGKIGFITSDSWLHWNYGRPLRNFLLDNFRLDILMRTDFNVFGDADVKTATAILTRKRAKADVGDHAAKIVSVHDRNFHRRTEREMPQKDLAGDGMGLGDNWALCFADLIPRPKIPMIPMSRAGTVRMGRKTGNNGFFVLDRRLIDKYRLSKRHYRPIVPDGVSGAVLDGADTGEYLLYVHEPKVDLQQTREGRRALRYLVDHNVKATPKRGKSRRARLVSEMPSVREHRPFWYSIKLSRPAPILLSLFANERVKIHENSGKLHALNNYAEFTPSSCRHVPAYLAFLSSSWFALLLEKSGHVAGGNALQIKTGDYLNFPVPDFGARGGQAGQAAAAPGPGSRPEDIMGAAWKKYRRDLDRGGLDRAVLGALGFGPGEMRQIGEDLARSVRRRLGW